MGTCTSSIKRRQKQHRRLHKRAELKDPTVLDNKQLAPIPFTVLRDQRPHSLLTNFEVQPSTSIDPISQQTNTSSLIQLYSSNTNNWMSSSSSTSHILPRIPIPKSRLPVHQTQSSFAGSVRPTHVLPTDLAGISRSMSTTNRASLPPSSQNPPQTRFGFIPRPTAPGLQPVPSLAERSRSISPSSTNSANSSSSSISHRIAKTTTPSKTTSNRSAVPPSNASKPKLPFSSPTNKDPSKTTPNRIRSNTLPQTSTVPIPPPKTDVNAVRDRYKTQKRMNFFARRTPLANSLRSPSTEASSIMEEKNEQTATVLIGDNQNDDSKTEPSLPAFSSQGDSAYASIAVSSTRPPSAQYSQANRQRASSTISSSSLISNVLNQDVSLKDENCSLKSEDLICDYDERLTIDSSSKNDPTDSSSSLSFETNKKPTMITSIPTTTKPNIPPFQPVIREHRASTIVKCSSVDKTNSNLQESLDELGRLSNRMDNHPDSEHNRRSLTRSVSLKPPPASLPPREDAEQITMDIESYRQVMKDVMIVKTVLHQLDRLLKHSDGANMTDSMIGSFHESMISSRHYSSSGVDGNARNSIDDTSSYDDLLKEILILRKEKEQDKQTIKLLQEQMYKYSSQSND